MPQHKQKLQRASLYWWLYAKYGTIYLKLENDSIARVRGSWLIEACDYVSLKDSEDARLPEDEEKSGSDYWKLKGRSESFQGIFQAIENDHEVIVSYIWRYADNPVNQLLD